MNNTTSATEIKITARAKAFASEGVREHRFLVTASDVLVYDAVSGHFTSCNSLSASAKRRIRKLAA